MDIKDLAITVREKSGSPDARRLRRTGHIPAILYGLKREPLSFSVEEASFQRDFVSGRRIFDLKLEGKEQICLLKEVQFSSVGDRLLHLDFQRVDETNPVTVSVALRFFGEPVAASHAYVEYPRQDLEISCLPRALPPEIEVNLGGMDVGSHLEASQIALPEGVSLVSPATDVVVTYHFKHAPAAQPSEEAATEEIEPEVLTERQPADEES